MQQFIIGSSEIPEIRNELSKVSRYLWEKGWAEKNAGNISYNVSGLLDDLTKNLDFDPPVSLEAPCHNLGNQLILVSGTGTRMRDLSADPHANTCLIQITEDGSGYRQMQKPELDDKILPTSELPSHLAIHDLLAGEKRRERVIIHTHPNKLIALTHIRDFCNQERINNLLWSVQPETCVFIHEGMGFVPYLRTGSSELAGATIQKFKNHRVVLWEKHGCLAIGENALQAFDLIDIAEKSTDIFFSVKSAGYDFEGIHKSDLQDLRLAFGLSENP
jgi:rhamnulose-1-phosphate aldolase